MEIIAFFNTLFNFQLEIFKNQQNLQFSTFSSLFNTFFIYQQNIPKSTIYSKFNKNLHISTNFSSKIKFNFSFETFLSHSYFRQNLKTLQI